MSVIGDMFAYAADHGLAAYDVESNFVSGDGQFTDKYNYRTETILQDEFSLDEQIERIVRNLNFNYKVLSSSVPFCLSMNSGVMKFGPGERQCQLEVEFTQIERLNTSRTVGDYRALSDEFGVTEDIRRGVDDFEL